MWELPQCRDVILFLYVHYFHSLHMSPPSSYLCIWDSSLTFGLGSLPPSILSLCTRLIFSIVPQSTHRIVLFPLIMCVEDFCIHAVSDHLIFLTLSREFFSGCHPFLPIKNMSFLLIFTELTSHQP